MTAGRTRGGARRAAWLPLAPVLTLYAIQFVVPMALVAVTSFRRHESAGQMGGFTTDNFTKILQDPYYLGMLGRSLLLAGETAVLTAVLGYPIAYALARGPRWLKVVLLVVVMVPLMTSSVVRSFGWMVLFARDGLFSTLAGPLGDGPAGLMYTSTGVLVATAHVLLPFMVLTLYGVLDRLNPTLVHASMNLGASRTGTFFRITLPLSMNGVVAGMLLVFATATSAFVTPQLIGGTRYRVAATEIYEQSINLLNWPLASAMAVLLVAIALLTMAVYTRLSRDTGGSGATGIIG
ncbi:ABC transporter permease [Phytohabitans sp. ZYX-F-186]|uniref:ABC transporter permease n=1 Tax=Phytohabitans maris TaxID=3071409 RepID=A0ABU0ZN85_9ACTN|nr:ABC transporter permease [Phytohabitans sp. ZYX-F-186]MDQ7908501.1 ABC transporter permease [Phytohabitans sp. ZYX-F-186]